MSSIAVRQFPKHVAVIMDGNGRWAKEQGLPRLAGHKAGGETLRKFVRHAGTIGLEHLSVYAFSTENWSRPKDEVTGLMKILVEFCKGEVKELKASNTRLKFIGDIDHMPPTQLKAIRKAEAALESCTGMQLNICMNYGARQEIVHAIKSIIESGIDKALINEDLVSSYLYTNGIPDPDLIIRTSGEMRISNFYLWQVAYAEFVFLEKYWPDILPEDLDASIAQFTKRERRFGKL